MHLVADTKITLTNGHEQWMRHVFKIMRHIGEILMRSMDDMVDHDQAV